MTGPPVARPSWSVMIPTYEPRTDYLRETLAGVLSQDWEGVDVQVEIVDDASEGFDPSRFVRELRDGRVGCHRQERRQGIGGNWNSCIERARGEWVHILHQDDLVHPGFYRHMERGISRVPDLGAAFCQGFVIDDRGERLRHTCRVDLEEAGLLTDWVQHVFVELAIQTPTIVVRTSVYEGMGGFDTQLYYTLDWEMWKRIAVRHPIWFDPEPLASYRIHGAGATQRLQRTGANLAEIGASIRRSSQLLPPALATDAKRRARDHYTEHAVGVAWKALWVEGDLETARIQWQGALQLAPLPVVLRSASRVMVHALGQWRRRMLSHLRRWRSGERS